MIMTVVTAGVNSNPIQKENGLVPFQTFPKVIDRVIASFFSTVVTDETGKFLKDENDKDKYKFSPLNPPGVMIPFGIMCMGDLLEDITTVRALCDEPTLKASQFNILDQVAADQWYWISQWESSLVGKLSVIDCKVVAFACRYWCGEDVFNAVITKYEANLDDDGKKKLYADAFFETAKGQTHSRKEGIPALEALAKRMGPGGTAQALGVCLKEAAARNSPEVCEFLIQTLHGDVNAGGLHAACEVNSNTRKFAMDEGRHFNGFSKEEVIARAKLFISAPNANVNLENSWKERPLHDVKIAAIAQALIEAGADVNAIDGVGNTPLHVIIRRNRDESEEIARILIKAGAKKDIKNKMKKVPLDYVEGDSVNAKALRELLKID